MSIFDFVLFCTNTLCSARFQIFLVCTNLRLVKNNLAPRKSKLSSKIENHKNVQFILTCHDLCAFLCIFCRFLDLL